jgi:hypothetical protein
MYILAFWGLAVNALFNRSLQKVYIYWEKCREYWMIYRGLGFLIILLLPHPLTPPLPSEICLSFSVFLCVAGRASWREWGRGYGRSQIIAPRESLVLNKSFNTLRRYVTNSMPSKLYRPRAVPLTGDIDNSELYITGVAECGQGQCHWGCDM